MTVDVDSLEDGKATVRERDSMAQERVDLDRMVEYLCDRLDLRPAKVDEPVEM